MAHDEPSATPPTGFGRVTAWLRRQKQQLSDHFAEYGGIAIVTYFVIFALTWLGFVIAIRAGISLDGAAGETGTVLTAYLATKATQPLRIIVTLAVTPLVAALWWRIRGRKPGDEAVAPASSSEAPRADEP
ncbi:MAG: hypothetical protein IPH07_28225 [Deltaproteobacteria bacterium]|nr:hypothetical protein [Deltaproteobacteria bacterium]MBK8234062.1 hypothetical protein [Deltaproteobacteria bacterium]MBK8714786.1 hypothetical protein [Deltaproteobacteria bacterium]MBP7289538.1 hypothetical protein [Nannocystaceae bacterium]